MFLQMKKAPGAADPAPEATSPRTVTAYRSTLSDVIPELDRAEHAAMSDAFRASPELADVAEIGGATCLAIRQMPIRLTCRVIGLESAEPLDEIRAFYGETPWWLYDVNGIAAELPGFEPDYGFMKFTRGVGPREAQSDLRVVRVEPDRAEDFAQVVVAGYEMPEWSAPFAANVVGRPGWSCYVAYDGDQPAGAGALHVHEQTGWLGFAATLPQYRGRGAQSAILAARIEGARRQGCVRVTTETGELVPDRPSNSYRNITRAGFREAGVRSNYKAA
jgi:GNAT superfamily N-acetyltransferase